VSDFGLSRIHIGEKTVATQTYGTVTHMPPELLSEGRLSKAADVCESSPLGLADRSVAHCSSSLWHPTPNHSSGFLGFEICRTPSVQPLSLKRKPCRSVFGL